MSAFGGKADISFLTATRSAASELLRIEHAIVTAGVDQLVLRQVAHASRWGQRTGCFHHVDAHEP